MNDRTLSLWQAWRERRDGAAFAALVEPEIGRALGLARSLGCGPEDAEDAVQEALTRLASERGAEPARVGVRAWFYRAVRDRARTETRSGWRRRGREKAAARPEVAPAAADSLEVREQVERALAELDADDREAVRLRHLQDLDYAEMGVVLGVSEGACRVRVHRALERLRARFGDGAAAVVAALPLPITTKGAVMVKGAIAAGGAASGAATAAATGGVIMASTGKVVAAVALAAGIAGAVAYTTLGPAAPPAGPGGTTVARSGPSPVQEDAGAGTAGPGRTGADPTAVDPSTKTPAGPSEPPAKPTPPSGRGGGGGGAGGQGRSGRPDPATVGPASPAEARPAEGGGALVDDFLAARKNPGDSLWSFGKARSVVRTGEGESRRVESTGDATTVNLHDLAGKSAVIEFGPGRFLFDPQTSLPARFHTPEADIRSLEIRGAGMDQTTLDGTGLWAFLSTREGRNLDNLVIRDLTYDGGPERTPFLDVRGNGSAVLENVRFRNIPNTGHCADVATSGRLYLAMKGCEFLGSGIESGICIRGSALALVEDCRFVRLQSAVSWGGGKDDVAVVNLLDCVFDGSPALDRAPAKGPDGTPDLVLNVRGGKVLLGPPGMAVPKVRQAWGADSMTEVTGVSFEPGTPAFSLREMLAALDRIDLPAGQAVAGIRAHPLDAGGPEGWVVLALESAEAGRKEHHYLLPAGEGAPVELPRKIQALRVPTPEQMDGALPLVQVLRQSGLAGETGAVEASFNMSLKVASGAVPGVYVRAPRGWPDAMLNGKTGENLNVPR